MIYLLISKSGRFEGHPYIYDSIINAREKFNFSHLHSQRLFKVHTASARKIGCSGDMLCLSFERPLLTLQEVSKTSHEKEDFVYRDTHVIVI